MAFDDTRLRAARAIPILEVAARLGIEGLKRSGLEQVGPCPVCGGLDRFGLREVAGVWNCRHCATGGDGIKLVQHVEGLGFAAALDWLLGADEAAPTPAEIAARRARAAAAEKKRAEAAADYRARAIALGRKLWAAAGPGGPGTVAAAYFAKRGFVLDPWPASLRFDPAAKYMVRRAGRLLTLHEGPALVAAIQNPERRITAVHRTWIDLGRANGKAEIRNPDAGALEPAKLIHGSKKGGAIRFDPPGKLMVIGEGVETTLTAKIAGAAPDLSGAVFWAGIDLGNMAGRMARVAGVRYSGEPDLTDLEAFVPPPCVERLVLIEDGDSDPVKTRAQLTACARRAMALRPGLRAFIWPAGAGRDLNDILTGETINEE